MGLHSPTLGEVHMQALEKIPDGSLERVSDSQNNQAALMRINAEARNRPLSSLIPEPLATQIEPMLPGYAKLYPKTRVAIYQVLVWLAAEGNWAKSKSTMCIELGMQKPDVDYWARKWPYMWVIANAICRFHADQAIGRVLGATTDAAIYGDSRDRRLYLEVFGHIKKEDRANAGVNITFVVDNLARPESKVIGASKVGSESDEP